MNDLNQIIQKNSEAVESASRKAVADGKFVVLKYSGVNFIDYEAFDTEAPRNSAAIAHTNEAPGNRVELLSPAYNGAPSSSEPV